MLSVTCVGNITHDHLFYVDEFPQLDDVAYVMKYRECIGGRGAIVAIILAVLDIPVKLCTCVGGQAFQAFEFLKNLGVGTETIHQDTSKESLFDVYIALSKKDQNSISFFSPKDINFIITPEQEHFVRIADIIYFSTHKKSFNLRLLEICDTKKQKIIHNFCKYFIEDDIYRDLLLKKSHVLIGNHIESSYLFEILNINDIKKLFHRYSNLENIIITYGDQGSKIYTREGEIHKISVYKTKALTPVGAGDAYAAGIIYGLARNMSITKSAKIASFIASKSVSADLSYPPLSTLKADVINYLSEI